MDEQVSASLHGVPALIINARLSDRTFQRLTGSTTARRILLPKGLEILTTSERQFSRWTEIGIPEQNVQIVGNLKVDAVPNISKNRSDLNALRKEFGFADNSLVIAGISTWPGEEELLVETMQQLRKDQIDARVLLIPRHAERRHKIASMLLQKDVAHHLRTHSPQAPNGTLVYLADTTGELATLIQCTDLAFGGKTLHPNRGGQNPIEPIALGIPLVLGPNFQNFQQTCGDLLVHDAIRITKSAEEKIRNILSRGKKVLIVGGSGFFLNGFLRPVVDDVDVSSEVRKRVLSIYESHGITSLIKELKIYNPEGFGDLDLNNPVRVIRSLERCIQSGKSLIDLQKNFMKLPVPYARFQKKMIWLDRSDGEIMERIEKRSQEMIYHGIIEETEEAVRAGIRNHPTLSGAVGYREVLDFLGVGGSKEELICSISKSTRKLVSKQRKWFRKHFPQGARFQINHQKSVEIDDLPWCAGT